MKLRFTTLNTLLVVLIAAFAFNAITLYRKIALANAEISSLKLNQDQMRLLFIDQLLGPDAVGVEPEVWINSIMRKLDKDPALHDRIRRMASGPGVDDSKNEELYFMYCNPVDGPRARYAEGLLEYHESFCFHYIDGRCKYITRNALTPY
jgi:hypothetical protein